MTGAGLHEPGSLIAGVVVASPRDRLRSEELPGAPLSHVLVVDSHLCYESSLVSKVVMQVCQNGKLREMLSPGKT